MSARNHVILFIGGTAAYADLLRYSLEQVPGLKFEFRHHVDPSQALNELSKSHIDLVFLSYQLTGKSAMEVLQSIQASGLIAPATATNTASLFLNESFDATGFGPGCGPTTLTDICLNAQCGGFGCICRQPGVEPMFERHRS